MKIVLFGAYGKLGSDILKKLIVEGYEVVAFDLIEKELDGIDKTKFVFYKIDVTNKESLCGTCNGADVVISTVGLTTSSATVSNYDIDYQGNLNILNEAKKAKIKSFVYISVIKSNEAPNVPMVNAKYLFENKLINSGLNYVIHRPTGYFYDIVKVFKPMINNGSVSLLGKKKVFANVIDTPDFANFIVKTMLDKNKTYNVGGCETYSYEEIAKMCFEAAGRKAVIKRVPVFLFTILANLPKNKKNGKGAIIRFSKFTLTHDLIGDTIVGGSSFKKYIFDSFKEDK